MADQGALFHMEPLQLPQAPTKGKRWGGRDSERARAHCRSLLPAPCWRGCGRLITLDWPEKDWHAGHVEDRAQGGAWDPLGTLPECRWCNTSQGGKLGAAVTNGRRAAVVPDLVRERTLKWY